MEIFKKFATRETKKDNRHIYCSDIQLYFNNKVFSISCNQKMLPEELVPDP